MSKYIILSNLKINKSLALILTAGSSFIFYITFKQYLLLKRYRHIKNPKTKGLLSFFTGNYNQLIEAGQNETSFCQLSLNWFKELGPHFKIYVFNQIMVFLNDEESVKKVFVDYDLHKSENSYEKIAYPYKIRGLGEGLVTQRDKQKWKSSRSVFNHAFSKSFLTNCYQEFNNKTNLLMEKLQLTADGKTLITLAPEINRFASDVISSVAFGINNDAINNSNNNLNSSINKLLEGIYELLVDPFIEFRPSKSKMIKEFKESVKELRNFARDYINQRIKDMENMDYVPNDILTISIKNSGKDFLDLEELVDQFLTFFIAGQETTSNSLAFAILELGQNSDALQKLKEEVDRVIGSKSQITYDDLVELEYTSCVFKETLRKWPIAPEMSRINYKHVKINGIYIPKNTMIVISPFVMGRNPEYFPEPDKFIPERFIKTNDFSKLNKFGLGPRNCIGQNFAKIEAKIFLAKFIQNFDFKLDETQSFIGKEMTTLRPRDGCRLYLTQRN